MDRTVHIVHAYVGELDYSMLLRKEKKRKTLMYAQIHLAKDFRNTAYFVH